MVWPKSRPTNIIVRMPNWIGDLVMATPILHDLRRHFKEARLTAMCLAKQAPILENDPNIDELFTFHQSSGWIHREQHKDVCQPLRQADYDLGLLLTNSFSSAWWFRCGHVRNRIGYAGHWRRLLLNYAVKEGADKAHVHQVVFYKRLLEPLGIPVSNTAPRLYIEEEALKTARQQLQQHGVDPRQALIGINPGAAYGLAKCWLPERFRELTLRLLEQTEAYILYFGDHATASLVNEICQGLPPRVINLAGKTSLPELVALIKQCTVLLTSDSGPMHIAAAVGTPPLALFGSTSDVRTGPYGLGKVIHKHVECSPCYLRVCPIDFRCMKRIEVDEVYRELMALVAQRTRN